MNIENDKSIPPYFDDYQNLFMYLKQTREGKDFPTHNPKM